MLLLGMVLAYSIPELLSIGARIVGSMVGGLGVTVCVNETIWLTKIKKLRSKVWRFIRGIDVISIFIGFMFIPLYWWSNGNWFVNDIMAVCSIVALMKFLKITSLSIAVVLLASLLLL